MSMTLARLGRKGPIDLSSAPSRADNRNGAQAPTAGAESSGLDEYNGIKFQVYEQLLRELDLDKVREKQGHELRQAVDEAATAMIVNQDLPIGRQERLRLVREVADELLGLGPIEPFLADPTVSEIMVNGPHHVYVERSGIVSEVDARFRDNAHVMRIIERIVAPLGRRIDEASPMVDARLPDGSRVNAIIPPLAIDGPTVTIRKFSRDPLTIDDLIRFGSVTAPVADFLRGCVQGRLNAVVSGGTGTGKTTLLNVMSSFIPAHERIITIEDVAELQLRQPHVVRLETRPPNIEGKGEINQRQLVRNALRMRPERIILGEVRSGEAFDMLQAMNTGHDGSLTTVHANTPRDVLARIENMVLMANLELPTKAIREQISSAINLIVQVSRFRDGSRRVTHVTEVLGMEGDVISLQDVFVFRQQGVDKDGRVRGSMQPSGLRPHCLERLDEQGIVLPPDLFSPSLAEPRGGEVRWRR
jgi:pilus assembly protein CpaF